MKSINLVYFGSPTFSAQILNSLLSPPKLGGDTRSRVMTRRSGEGVPKFQVVAVARPPAYKVCGVVTTPDKPTGRQQQLTPSPIAQLASSLHLPVFKPQKLDSDNLAHLKLLKPNLFLVASYGKIIPQNWLDTPTIATLNLHFSLLPKYRGALCIQQAIKNQDKETGVTMMVMDQEMDHGLIIAQIKQDIDLQDNVATLTAKLTQKAIQLLQDALPRYLNGEITPQEQDHTSATYTPSYKTLTRDSAFIPWKKITPFLSPPKLGGEVRSDRTEGVLTLHALVRSLNPEPGAWTKVPTLKGDLEIKLLQTSLENYDLKNSLKIVNCKLKINFVQLPGRNPISWKQFLAGNQLQGGI